MENIDKLKYVNDKKVWNVMHEFYSEENIALTTEEITTLNYNNDNIKKVYKACIKRIVDIIIGIIGTIILIPLTAIIWTIEKLSQEKGPVFYAHSRIGKNGKVFKVYKFRSMVVDADKVLKEYLEKYPDERKEYEENIKLKNDPRITKIGKFLRKTSLDEWPQFLNILLGDMSLIGPRPIVEKELELYGDNKQTLLSVKPGLTGYWQANGRSNTTYDQRIQMELYYVKNLSPLLDLKIFFKTFIAVLKKEGAV